MKPTIWKASALTAATLLAACGGSGSTNYGSQQAALQGDVSEESSGSGTSSFDSSGSIHATSKIAVSVVSPDGSLSLIGSGTLDASGHYTVEVPANQHHLVVRALDASDHVLASVEAESSGAAGSTTTVDTMTAHSSAVAEVYVRMVAQGHDEESIDLADLSQRIDAGIATQLRTDAEAGTAVETHLQALASAALAAQAVARENAQHADGSLKATATAMSQASAAFRLVLKAHVGASASDQALIDAAAHSEGSMEAHASAVAVNALLSAGSASQSEIDAAAAAGAQLEASVSAAADESAVVQAFADFQATVATSTQASVLNQIVSANASNSTEASSHLQAILQAEAQARAAMNASVEAALQVTGEVHTDAMASAIVNAWLTFDAAIRSETAQVMPNLATQANLAADLLVVAQGSFLTTAH